MCSGHHFLEFIIANRAFAFTLLKHGAELLNLFHYSLVDHFEKLQSKRAIGRLIAMKILAASRATKPVMGPRGFKNLVTETAMAALWERFFGRLGGCQGWWRIGGWKHAAF